MGDGDSGQPASSHGCYVEEAAAIRREAERVKSEEVREQLLQIAVLYEHLAHLAQRVMAEATSKSPSAENLVAAVQADAG